MANEKLDLSNFRNIGIIAHIDAGKTTTTEHVLYYAGVVHRLGAVDSGNTTTDYDEEEQERGITIYSACIPFQWRETRINLIDTPGHVDFTAEVERSLRVLDGCVVVFDAQKGVEAQSETVWRQADKYEVPRLVFVNKMDVVGANFENAISEITSRLEAKPVPIIIPMGSGSIKDSDNPFHGIIDLVEMKALEFDPANQGKTIRIFDIPEKYQDYANTWRENLIDKISAIDSKDRIATFYLEGMEIPTNLIREVLREGTLRRIIQPVLCGSGREHIGIQTLLDGVSWYLPSPLDKPPVKGINPKKKDKEESRNSDTKDPFCGLVFKITSDAHGELFFVRIYSGVLKVGSRVLNTGRDVKEFVGKIYHTAADPASRTELTEAFAGDIVAVVGMKEAITGDTICDPTNPILLEKIKFAEAVVSRSIEPESSADKQKLIDTLNILRKEDPTFSVKIDPETGQTLMSGMGMLHLEIKQHRMERDFRLKVRAGKPRVSYRETLKKALRVEGECIRQSGSAGLFAKLVVEFSPYPPNSDKSEDNIKVSHKLKPDDLTQILLNAAEQGIKLALQSGELGYPVMNVQAIITAAKMDEQLSTEVAFQSAGADAVQKALKDNMILLEPVMKLEVTLPEEYLGPITADLNARRAEIRELHIRGKMRVVEAIVPMAKLFDYADKVRSLSQGRASSTMEPYSYSPAPNEVLKNMLNPFAF
ncbi:MAG: elongation factor G [Gemmataceae bacterium]|nr:elongation factor G [Gemmataceae bacterium]